MAHPGAPPPRHRAAGRAGGGACRSPRAGRTSSRGWKSSRSSRSLAMRRERLVRVHRARRDPDELLPSGAGCDAAGRHAGPGDGAAGAARAPPGAAPRGGGSDGARLHVRLVFLFSLIAAVPTLLVVVFASLAVPVGRRVLVLRQFARAAGERQQAGARLLRAEPARRRQRDASRWPSDLRDYPRRRHRSTSPDFARALFATRSSTASSTRARSCSRRRTAACAPPRSSIPSEDSDPRADSRRARCAALDAGRAGRGAAPTPDRIEAVDPDRSRRGHLSLHRAQLRAAAFSQWQRAQIDRSGLRRADPARARAAAALQPRAVLRQPGAGRARGVVRAALRRPPGRAADRSGRRGARGRRGQLRAAGRGPHRGATRSACSTAPSTA